MTRYVWLALALVACGGDGGGGGDADGGDTDTDGSVPFDADLCDEIPQYDLPSLTCEQLLNALVTTMTAAGDCNSTDDCQVLSGQCDQMLNECYYPVNSCVSQATVGEFVSEYSGCQGDDRCDCGAAPPVECIAGRCEFVL